MTQLTIGFSDSEDRLWLLLTDDTHQFWLSRRFCANLLRHLEKALTDSCPGGEMQGSLDAQTRVSLEHQAAHESEHEATPVQPKNDAVARQSSLLTSILLTVDSGKVDMELIAPGHSRSLTLNRAQAHQFLAALWQHSQNAKWDLPNPGWQSK